MSDEKVLELLKKVITEIKNIKHDILMLKEKVNASSDEQSEDIKLDNDTWDPRLGPPPKQFKSGRHQAFAYEDNIITRKSQK